jgi:hypothetical protein
MEKYMAKITMQSIEDPDIRGELSDILDRYITGASQQVAALIIKSTKDDMWGRRVSCPDTIQKQISEILTENIYIPMMMGEERRA